MFIYSIKYEQGFRQDFFWGVKSQLGWCKQIFSRFISIFYY